MVSIFFAGNMLLLLFGLLLIFHLLVLSGLVPHDLVWAGKFQDRNKLIKMESISLLILTIAVIIVAHKMKYLSFLGNPIVINGGMWMLFVFFTLNTVGNLTAKNPIEKYGFGLLTVVIALLALRLAIAP